MVIEVTDKFLSPFLSPGWIDRSFSICKLVLEVHLEIYKPSLLRKCMWIKENMFFSSISTDYFLFVQVKNCLELLGSWSKSIRKVLE